ncbi:hypothetical protein O3G_MSEX012557 [Manduca sexta]|uniref:Uncharacterized protein n=1 Tax=Manduca sexta TaxID=7130 RepID=A0A921ZR18_MANSE|nr:hypothetical protein O3G_MSEX012557 [Manduca sexta]
MYIVHEGEILLKEKYGSMAKERYYIKPPEQANIVVLDEENTNNVTSWFTKILLPQGYPDSVSEDYIAYQIWDTAQAFCSTISGTLATQAVLTGVGVGDTTATPLSATITWVVKDGFGHLGRILFAYSHGTYLDAYSKKWRLCADFLNDIAMCIELTLPLFRNHTTAILCTSTVLKAIVGVAGGATRAAMTQHHALRGNLADVSAKDSAQETAVNLIASFTALFIISLFGDSILIFILMIILHIIFNYFAVRAVCLKTLNEPRFLQLIDVYLKNEVIASVSDINREEPIFFYQMGPNMLDEKLCGFTIKLGQSIKDVAKDSPNAIHMKRVKEIYEDRSYMLLPDVQQKVMFVLLRENVTSADILCAYFHAVLLSITICAINGEPLAILEKTANLNPFAKICFTLKSVEWSREEINGTLPSGLRYAPSYDLMKHVDKIVQKEWNRIDPALKHMGKQ